MQIENPSDNILKVFFRSYTESLVVCQTHVLQQEKKKKKKKLETFE